MEISVHQVSKLWGPESKIPTLAIDEVTHSFASQKFTCLLGPSGCGKSTLLQIIAGLSTTSSGKIEIVDHSTSEVIRPGDKSVMVWQTFNLFPWLTVMENISFGLKLRKFTKKERREKAKEFIAFMGLRGFEDRLPSELSGGMRQRVSLARALIMDPSVLLMDEPFGALDAQTKIIMQQELQRLFIETNKTIIFVTHSIEESILLADEVVVMTARPGRIKSVVPIDLKRPRTTKEFSDANFGRLYDHIYGLIREEVEKTIDFERGRAN